MANSLSAKKRIRQNEKRNEINKARKSRIKTQTRHLMDAIAARDVAKAEEQFKMLSSLLDRVAHAGTIHKNNASRRKSRLHARLLAIKSTS